MNIDALVFEIGSTTTLVNAFDNLNSAAPLFLGQGQYRTTVTEGDVSIGLRAAMADLEQKKGEPVKARRVFATSSAAGGLKMCVVGLVYDMTVKAARAAALGAGAIVSINVAGKLDEFDMSEIISASPNLLLLSGGTDYGERETALYNADIIAHSGLNIPVIYAGNIQNQGRVAAIFKKAGISCYITENVYPKLDLLNIEPCRKLIHAAFEEHIVKAPGMEHIREIVNGEIIPTPGAVMEATQALYNELADIVVVDIGGATTDVHSATAGSDEIAAISMDPEPFFKRTVEGDLGLYVNAHNVVERCGDRIKSELCIDLPEVMKNYLPIPETREQLILTQYLAVEAGIAALTRHAGRLRHIFSSSGRRTYAEGKDLTKVRRFIGTGGALTRLEGRERIARRIADCNNGTMLLPKPGEMELLFDNDYIFASLGVLSLEFKEAAVKLMKNSIGI